MDCPILSLSQESKLISQNSSAELLFIDDQTTTTDLTMQLVNIQSTENQSGLSALGEIKSQYISQLSAIVHSSQLDTTLTNLLSTVYFQHFFLSSFSFIGSLSVALTRQLFFSSFSAVSHQFLISFSSVSHQFLSSFSAVSQQFLSSFSAVFQQFLSSFSAVFQQFFSSFLAVSQQFLSK